jgi:hypothetical protein
MAAETTAARPRRSLLVALGVALLALLVYWEWPSATPAPGASNPAVEQRTPAAAGTDPASLEVKIAWLEQTPPAPDDMERNPFRFQPKAPPPAPAPPPGSRPPGAAPPSGPPPPPPGPPPIPLKYIGRLDSASTGPVAIFSDGRGLQPRGREGDIILGQYRIVHIGVESVVLEYVDGRGRQTIPLRGQ